MTATDPLFNDGPDISRSSREGVEQYMTVDAFDVSVSVGTSETASVSKDHSGPLPDEGRTQSQHRQAMDREREWLRRAAGIPGVVRLVEHPDNIVTEFAGSRTLRSDCPDPPTTARALACVADTITELAGRGLTHGSVVPEHVILPTDGAAVLCSPNTGTDPADDLVALGVCVEFATQQWHSPPDSIARWLLLAKQLQDQDPTMGPERAAQHLRNLAEIRTDRSRRSRLGVLIAAIGAGLALVLVAATLTSGSQSSVTGPEVEVDGSVIRVGRDGQVALVHPGDRCIASRLYLLDPETSQIWEFDTFDTGTSGTPVAMVPGATDLGMAELNDGCFAVVARGPAGEVTLP
jgi:hypothetical protein